MKTKPKRQRRWQIWPVSGCLYTYSGRERYIWCESIGEWKRSMLKTILHRDYDITRAEARSRFPEAFKVKLP